MKKILIVIIVSMILTSCGKSLFETSMEKGKSFLQEGNYEEASKQFSAAYIEKPTDKDLELLIKTTNDGLYKEKLMIELVKYQELNSSIFAEHSKIWLEVSNFDAKNISDKVVKKNYDSIIKIYSDAVDLGRKNAEFPEIKDVHDKFISALDSLRNYLNELNNFYSTPKTSNSRLAKMYLGRYEDAIQEYRDSIKKLKEN